MVGSVRMMSSGKFWDTMNLLVGSEFRKTRKDVIDDVHEWVERIVTKKKMRIDKCEVSFKNHWMKETSSGYGSVDIDQEVEDFIKAVDLPKIECKFSHPHVRSRLEKLMGSNMVSLTDREYMQKLQERILEEYAESMEKRIKTRQSEEMERVKNLVLSGKIPLRNAPESMSEHPVMIIERYCNRLIAERRSKIKVPKTQIPTHLYYDDTPDPPSGLSIENGHIFRKPHDKLCNSVQRFVTEADLREYDEEEEMQGEDVYDVPLDSHMYTKEEYERLKYESPLIKQLKQCQTVEELYALADEIIGDIQNIDGTSRRDFDALSIMTGISEATSAIPSGAPPSEENFQEMIEKTEPTVDGEKYN